MDFSKVTAESYLTSLLCKNLRITTSDTRLFVGEFKCTDAGCNIILSHTYEYRLPSPPAPSTPQPDDKVMLDMTSRYLGLVVVPGEYITKIEVEEFTSQVKAEGSRWAFPDEGKAGMNMSEEGL